MKNRDVNLSYLEHPYTKSIDVLLEKKIIAIRTLLYQNETE